MADITAIFFILVLIGLAYPAMLAAWWLAFPNLIARAQERIERTPWRAFWLGLGMGFVIAIPTMILLSLPFGPAKFTGWLVLALGLTMISIGAGGIAAHLGDRLQRVGTSYSPVGAFIRGAVILELAVFFPVLGWLFLWPLMLIMALGITVYALLNSGPTITLRSPGSVPSQV